MLILDNAGPLTLKFQRLLLSVLLRLSAKATQFPKDVHDLANKHELLDLSLSTQALIKALKQTIRSVLGRRDRCRREEHSP